eukprot:735217-Prymnesium_polylepis.1
MYWRQKCARAAVPEQRRRCRADVRWRPLFERRRMSNDLPRRVGAWICAEVVDDVPGSDHVRRVAAHRLGSDVVYTVA